MAKLIYSAICSLDGYVADAEGNFDWSMPDEEVHTFVNDLERPIGTYLFGRRMYEVMRYWETAPTGNRERSAEEEYAKIWQAADKIIYSKSLEDVSTARTRLERDSTQTPSSNSSGLPALSVVVPTLLPGNGLGWSSSVPILSPILWEGTRPFRLVSELECWTNAVSATVWYICNSSQWLMNEKPAPVEIDPQREIRSQRPTVRILAYRRTQEHCPRSGCAEIADNDSHHDHDRDHRALRRIRIRGHGHCNQCPAGREDEAKNRDQSGHNEERHDGGAQHEYDADFIHPAC